MRVTEDCLNGRRTVWDDPFKPGRNGLVASAQRMEAQSPLALVILMLGTNDFQFCHPHNNAWAAAQGVTTLVNEIRRAPIEPGMPVPPILIGCPPPMRSPRGAVALKFPGRGAAFARIGRCLSRSGRGLGLQLLRCRKRDGIEPRGRHPSGSRPAHHAGPRHGRRCCEFSRIGLRPVQRAKRASGRGPARSPSY